MVSFRKPPRQSNMAKCKILYLLKFDVFPIKPSIYGRFPIATFDYRRVNVFSKKKMFSTYCFTRGWVKVATRSAKFLCWTITLLATLIAGVLTGMNHQLLELPFWTFFHHFQTHPCVNSGLSNEKNNRTNWNHGQFYKSSWTRKIRENSGHFRGHSPSWKPFSSMEVEQMFCCKLQLFNCPFLMDWSHSIGIINCSHVRNRITRIVRFHGPKWIKWINPILNLGL